MSLQIIVLKGFGYEAASVKFTFPSKILDERISASFVKFNNLFRTAPLGAGRVSEFCRPFKLKGH